ncbi:MAG: FadR/GntR family transcriptional regulator [Puia sp.]|nr:FadR/GntR family transcriptional regulator [Puia sp.]
MEEEIHSPAGGNPVSPFQKIGSEKLLSGRIEESIESAIRKKQYLAGQKLPTEGELCKLFSVSRTVVREAFRRLSARGLVVIRQGSGAYVNEISSESAIDSINLYLELTDDGNMIFDIIRARQLFEPEIAGLAALYRTTGELEELAGNMEELRNCPLDDIEKETEIDSRFHILIAKATHNTVVSLLMRPVFDSMPRFKRSIFAKNKIDDRQAEKRRLIQFHEDIYQAINSGDSREAAYAMQTHIKRSERNFLDSLKPGVEGLKPGVDG